MYAVKTRMAMRIHPLRRNCYPQDSKFSNISIIALEIGKSLWRDTTCPCHKLEQTRTLLSRIPLQYLRAKQLGFCVGWQIIHAPHKKWIKFTSHHHFATLCSAFISSNAPVYSVFRFQSSISIVGSPHINSSSSWKSNILNNASGMTWKRERKSYFTVWDP